MVLIEGLAFKHSEQVSKDQKGTEYLYFPRELKH